MTEISKQDDYAMGALEWMLCTLLVSIVVVTFMQVLSKTLQDIVEALVAAALVLFLSLFVWQAVLYTLSVSGQTAPGTGLSKAVPVSSAVFGGLLMIYYVVQNWLHDSRREEQT